MIDKIEKTLIDIRKHKPLILCLTNFVTVEFVANSLLALGAAPFMITCQNELEELMKMASALYINIGTLDHNFISLSQKAIELANQYEKPIVIDPVGAGASNIRTQVAKSILPFASIIRGNASEILALGSNIHTTYGVEAINTIEDAKEVAINLSREHNTTVIASGPIDFITNGDKSFKIAFGSPLMQLITGMGCAMTAVIAAFNAIIEDPFEAGSIATHYFTLCGEIVAKSHQAPGTFKIAFIDQLYRGIYEI